MEKNKTYTIDGRTFDSVTGMPIDKPKQAVKKPVNRPSSSQAIHSRTKKSETLDRRFVKKQPSKPRPISGGQVMDIAPIRSGKKFASHPKAPMTALTPSGVQPSNSQTTPAPAQTVKSKLSHPLTSTVVLKQKIKSSIPSNITQPSPEAKKSKQTKKKSKISKIIFGLLIFGVVVVGLVATYYFVPSWSVQLSSIQSGIDVGYPSYTPEDFAIKGPVTYNDGKVVMTFSNNNNQTFTITQTKSSLDSSALLENVVKPTAKQTYTTNQYSGITIYTYENTSAWVNGGTMYIVESNVPLKSEDVRRIATSM